MTGQNWKDVWNFTRYTSLNHGSVGATPVELMRKKAELDQYINGGREAFIRKGEYQQMLDRSQQAVAAFVGAGQKDLVLTDRVTDALNSVVKSVDLGPGDELLVTNHIYPSYKDFLTGLSQRQGFKLVTVEIPYPLESDEQIVDAILAKASGHTRLALIDHISSPSALVFPVKRIVAALEEKGIDTFVDGAHAPGQLPVDVQDIGAAYYAGAHYKWLCAPWASGFLHVRSDKQHNIIPAVSSGDARLDVPFQDRFGWQGVMDPLPRIMIADTITYMTSLHPEGWDGIYKRNHDLAIEARDIVFGALGLPKACPDHMVGSMFTIPLKGLQFDDEALKKPTLLKIYDYMTDRHRLEVYASEINGVYLPRVSCHLYNERQDYEKLAHAMVEFVNMYTPQQNAAAKPSGNNRSLPFGR